MAASGLSADAVGTAFPPGSYRIEPEKDSELREILDAPSAVDDIAHPAWGYIAAQGGIDIDIDGILRLADAKAEDGPILASTKLDYRQPLRIGVDYRVTGEVLTLERKHGRKLGSFDLYTFRIDIDDPDTADLVTRLTAVWMLPRGADDEA